MEIRPIRTEQQYQEALTQLEEMSKRSPRPPVRELFDVLSILVEAYERKQKQLASPLNAPSTARYADIHFLGFSVHMETLWQESVYRGLLAGMPTRHLNYRNINELLKKAGPGAVLIKPEQHPYSEKDGHLYFLGEPYRLPSIGCIGEFYCHKTARDPEMYCSRLTVVWFQEEYALPIAPDVLAQMQQLDWATLATDHED